MQRSIAYICATVKRDIDMACFPSFFSVCAHVCARVHVRECMCASACVCVHVCVCVNLYLLSIHAHKLALGRQLRLVKVLDHLPCCGEAGQLIPVQSWGAKPRQTSALYRHQSAPMPDLASAATTGNGLYSKGQFVWFNPGGRKPRQTSALCRRTH